MWAASETEELLQEIEAFAARALQDSEPEEDGSYDKGLQSLSPR